MEIRVLGDLTIDGGPLSPKERALLATLVLRSGNVVTPSELADSVWGDDLPGTWPKQVQAAIAHIRRALGAGAVTTSRGGYRLAIASDAIDANRFEQLLRLAGEYRAAGDPARAVDTIERALGLWSGEPYADLSDWPPAVVEAERLAEVRTVAEEDLQQCRLECGEHRAVVADAERLVRTEPLRERRWAILATALYRGGRQADALAALRSARELLGDELGIEPGSELVALETAILRQDPSLETPPVPTRTSDECPYRGLQPFGTDDAEEFFGRDEDISAVLARVSGAPFLAVSGPSGCGKSSLLLAGVVPALRSSGETVAILGTGSASPARLRDALAKRAHADVLVVDQFEELFHSGLPEARIAEFCELLADAVSAKRRIVLAVRSDFLDDCASERAIGPLFADGVYLVGPLSPAGLRRAIEEPAKLAGLRIEPGLTELIVRDAAGSPGVLPHVSHALVETWLRREGATMTVAGYEESGGISGAIAQSADQLYLSLDPAQREILRSTFLRLVEIGADGAPMRRRIPLKPLRADAAHDQVLSGLARARLVSAEEDSLIVAHESLATAWPRLRGWLDDDAEGMRTMHALAAAAGTWEADGRPDDDLYRGARLQAAIEWRNGAGPELTESERAFLEASEARQRATIDEIAHRARHDRRQNRRLRVLLVAALALFAVAATASGFVAAGAQETERQRTDAQIGELTSTSLALRSTERDVAALLAAEAFRRWPDDARTRSALLGVMQAAGGLTGTTYPDDVLQMAGRMIPDTRQAVVVADDRISVYDVDTAEVVRTIDVPREDDFVDTRIGPSISADGRLVALGEHTWGEEHLQREGAMLSVADITTGTRTLGPVVFDDPMSTLALSPDGTTVATIDFVGELRLVDTETGDVRRISTGARHQEERNNDRSGTLAFTPSGTLLYGTMGGDLLLIDPVQGVVAGAVRPPDGSTNVAMAVVSDSLAIVAGDLRISAVDLSQRVVVWSRDLDRQSLEPYPWITVSIARGTVYGGDLWGRIEERTLSTGELTGRSFEPQLGIVGPLQVSSDGSTLDVIGRGTPAFTSWRLDGGGPATRIIAPGSVIRDRYSADGTLMFVGAAPDEPTQPVDEYAVIDARTGDVVFRPPDGWHDMGWTGELVIGLNGDEELGFVSPKTGEEWPIDFPELNFLEASTDGRKLYAGTDDGSGDLVTLDARTGKRIGPTFSLGEFTQSVSTNSDASLVLITATNTDSEAMTGLFDGRTGELLRTTGPTKIGMNGTMGTMTRLTGRGEIISTSDIRITRFDAETFEPIGQLAGASGGFAYLSVSDDGRTLSSFSGNGTVSVYDLVDGVRLGDPIHVASPDLLSGYLRPNGEELAVNADEGIAIWNLDPAAQAKAACRIAGRDLTAEEWNTYLRGLGGHRSTCGFGDR